MDERTELTQIHGKVIEALDSLGIDHDDEYPVEIDGEEFQLDCYLPGLHACVEADGPSHGMRGKRDRRRDALLRSIGIPTLRLRWKLIESETKDGLALIIIHWASRALRDVKERRALRPPAGGTFPTRPYSVLLDDEDIGGL